MSDLLNEYSIAFVIPFAGFLGFLAHIAITLGFAALLKLVGVQQKEIDKYVDRLASWPTGEVDYFILTWYHEALGYFLQFCCYVILGFVLLLIIV